MSDEKVMGQVIQIDEARIRDHLGEMVRGTVARARVWPPRGQHEKLLSTPLGERSRGGTGFRRCRLEVRHRARAHPGAPQGFGDVLDPPYRNPRQILSISASSTELSRRR
jgi:hypothetical protein